MEGVSGQPQLLDVFTLQLTAPSLEKCLSIPLIELVAHDGVTQVCQVYSDLVRSSAEGDGFYPAEFLLVSKPLKNTELSPSALATGVHAHAHSNRTVIPGDGFIDKLVLERWVSLHQSEIALVHSPVLKQSLDSDISFSCPSHQEDS